MLKTTRLFARTLTLRRFALTSAGRSQRARRASAYQALKGISVVGCCCQNRRSAEIAITRIAYEYAPMVGASQSLMLIPPGEIPPGIHRRGTKASLPKATRLCPQKWKPSPTACSMRWTQMSPNGGSESLQPDPETTHSGALKG